MVRLGDKTLFDIFAKAIEQERKAQDLYRQAALLAGDGTPLAEMFRHLEHEERGHESRLAEDYAQFKAKLSPERP
ncbi:MAG: hypothetical protein HY903_04015 [Deltaproteobacteria bacterium]|nr:hypothetical protein [Deltaproteobacteria bacterium]